ncbi:MAG: YhcH/YjgK/YiaL family protein [Flavobacteriales bacterium]|nr:YhcH/YjgK/YiaL family protein [Flavobacteriales bacterium]
MILDHIHNSSTYNSLHPLFKKGFDFIHSFDINNYKEGRNEILGDEIFALVFNLNNLEPNTKLEVHNTYIDIQFLVKGTDQMGWRERSLCTKPEGNFNAEKDVQFFTDVPENTFDVAENHFVIFYPTDAHAPLMQNKPCVKIVIKVKTL